MRERERLGWQIARAQGQEKREGLEQQLEERRGEKDQGSNNSRGGEERKTRVAIDRGEQRRGGKKKDQGSLGSSSKRGKKMTEATTT